LWSEHGRESESAVHRIPRVLIVEDEFLIALELESTLRSVAYHVLGPVATVQEALELLRTESPDAAVLDVNLQANASHR
jgi:two-component SAPR family response regulator